jgi:hypothetical protein
MGARCQNPDSDKIPRSDQELDLVAFIGESLLQ